MGRVAAIINHKANKTWDKKNVRFGWIDFIDNPEVSDALIHTVEEWGKERGMTHIQGPLGFTDFYCGRHADRKELRSTQHHGNHLQLSMLSRNTMERRGFFSEKEADWVEYQIYIPDAIPDNTNASPILSSVNIISKIKKYTSQGKIARDYGQAIFELMNGSL